MELVWFEDYIDNPDDYGITNILQNEDGLIGRLIRKKENGQDQD